MQNTCLKLQLAALVHDIGKFVQGVLDFPKEYIESNADLYQPFNKSQGRHTHQHALYTAAFIEER